MSKIKSSSLSGIMCGTGEYTTGYVHNKASVSDKKIGVVGLCLFELRRLGQVSNLGLVGTTGKKFEGIRNHLKNNIGEVYNDLDVSVQTFPDDSVEKDINAYKAALDTLKKGDFCTIFTPDDTHYEIALYAIERGLHVLLTKPAVKTLAEHNALQNAAVANNCFVMIEFHKRFDPIYINAQSQAQNLGDFGFFNGYMSQPHIQLDTFRHWAGKSSDISYYLNSHHIDVHCWMVQGLSRPLSVSAVGSKGLAQEKYGIDTEDTISLSVQWENMETKSRGIALYTSSWAAPTDGEVHSQQRFMYQGHKGELNVNQAHRGYTMTVDKKGYKYVNPLYMNYSKDHLGHFNGHQGYGYKSIATFIEACNYINAGLMDRDPSHLPTLSRTKYVTGILEAGRISLDNNGCQVTLHYENEADNMELTSLNLSIKA